MRPRVPCYFLGPIEDKANSSRFGSSLPSHFLLFFLFYFFFFFFFAYNPSVMRMRLRHQRQQWNRFRSCFSSRIYLFSRSMLWVARGVNLLSLSLSFSLSLSLSFPQFPLFFLFLRRKRRRRRRRRRREVEKEEEEEDEKVWRQRASEPRQICFVLDGTQKITRNVRSHLGQGLVKYCSKCEAFVRDANASLEKIPRNPETRKAGRFANPEAKRVKGNGMG